MEFSFDTTWININIGHFSRRERSNWFIFLMRVNRIQQCFYRKRRALLRNTQSLRPKLFLGAGAAACVPGSFLTQSIDEGYSKFLCYSTTTISSDNFSQTGFNYDKYRTLTPGVMNTIKMEREHSAQQIDELMTSAHTELSSYRKVTRTAIENEILSASKQQLDESSSLTGRNVGELGPTGSFLYDFRDSQIAGNRSYVRKHIVSGVKQTVFSQNFHIETLGSMSLSTDEVFAVRLVQYTTDGMKQRIVLRHIESGFEHDINFSRLFEGDDYTNGEDMPRIQTVEFGPKIEEQNRNLHTLFFTTCDDVGRPDAVYGCVIFGDDNGVEKRVHSTPELILKDNNTTNFVDVQRTKGCAYIAIHSSSKTSNEIHLVGKDLSPILVRERQAGVQYFVDCGENNDIMIMAHSMPRNKYDAPDKPGSLPREFSIFEHNIKDLPLNKFGNKVIATSDTVRTKAGHFIEDMELFETTIVLHERSFADGIQRLKTIDRRTGDTTVISMDDTGIEAASGLISSSGNMNYHSPHYQFNIESPVIPPITLQYDFKTCKFLYVERLKKIIEERLKYRSYKNERVLVDVEDGILCPLTIIHNSASKVPSNRRPVLLSGYGCYGENQNLGYDPTMSPLLERGFAIAYCHGRGGKELGQQWYEAGSRLNKINAVKDYIACAQYLSSTQSILNADTEEIMNEGNKSTFIAARAFSAGGVVVGASVNEKPHLFHAVSLSNAFMDVLGTMSNPSLYLTEHEWDEFGNPQNSVERECISSYCPLTNVRKQPYPPTLLIGAIDDENVPYYNALMYGMKVRDFCDGDKTSVLIHILERGGHHLHGKSIEVAALEVSHILGLFGRHCNDPIK